MDTTQMIPVPHLPKYKRPGGRETSVWSVLNNLAATTHLFCLVSMRFISPYKASQIVGCKYNISSQTLRKPISFKSVWLCGLLGLLTFGVPAGTLLNYLLHLGKARVGKSKMCQLLLQISTFVIRYFRAAKKVGVGKGSRYRVGLYGSK